MRRSLWVQCVALALLQAACCGGGVWTWQCMFGGHGHSTTMAPLTERELRDQHIRAGLNRFLWGSRCDCADATCTAAGAARDWCRGRGPECVDELLIRAPRGYVTLRANPLRLERIDNVLEADGSLRSFLRNQVMVRVESGNELLIVTPIGPDAGQIPLRGPLRIEVPHSDANLSIDGTNYICAAPSENATGLSYEPKKRKPRAASAR